MVVEKRNNGISLISLIITIIVIIILAAIVIFSGMDTPEKAQLSKVISDIDNVQTAVDQAYYGLYTEKAVAGEVWTPSQFYEAVATGEKNRDNLNGTGLIEIGENSLVDINLPKYEGRKWYIAVSDVSDTVKTGSAVLSPGFESQGKTYATLLDIQTGGSDGNEANGETNPVDMFLTDGNGTILGLNSELYDYYDEWNCYIYSKISNIVIPDKIGDETITTIGQKAFGYSYNINEVSIKSGVKSIEFGAFYDCINLTNITIPNSVTSIGDRAFWNCTSLTNVVIPNSVTSIGDYAFLWCSDLASITIESGSTLIVPDDKWGALNATIIYE